MEQIFVVTGLNPATGRVVELVIAAPSQGDAKTRAQSIGLQFVAAAPVPAGCAIHEGHVADPTIRERGPILVVDDHEDSRDLLARMLQYDGYSAVAVGSTLEALAFLATTTPLLVITDYEMPGMNGLELFAEIRKRPHLKSLPVLVFSAGDDHARRASINAGVTAFIAKASLDWAHLRRLVFEHAGAPAGDQHLPHVQGSRAKGAG